MHKPAPSKCTLTGRRPQAGASSSETAVLHGPRHAMQMLRIGHMLSEGTCAAVLDAGTRSHSEAPAVHCLQRSHGYGHAVAFSFTYLVLVVIARWQSAMLLRASHGRPQVQDRSHVGQCASGQHRTWSHLGPVPRRLRFASSFSAIPMALSPPHSFLCAYTGHATHACAQCSASCNCPGRTPDTLVRKHSSAIAVAVTSDLMRW